jgi:hypothetical protein
MSSLIDGGRRVLLLNPPVADTLEPEQQHMIDGVEPFGLLRLGTYFRRRGCEVGLIDCIRDPLLGGRIRRHVRKTLACGNGAEEGVVKEIHHYGLDAGQLTRALRAQPEPDLIAVSSIFTWHLEATREAIGVCKEVFPGARLVLGGNVTTLCPEQARGLGADHVFAGDVAGAEFLPTAIDLLPGRHETDFVSMVKGCPHHCDYCVTPALNQGRVTARAPEQVVAEIRAKREAHGTTTFVFYDDFVQWKQSQHLDPFLDLVTREAPGVTLEFALGFSAQLITTDFAARLRSARIERVILALETISELRSQEMNRPQKIEEFVRAVDILKRHGYRGRNLRAFFLMGLPGQTTEEILRGILFLYDLGVTPSLTTYTLTPGSGHMARDGGLASGASLEELAPCLWRFASPAMKVRELDVIYRQFHERFFPLEQILASTSSHPVTRRMQGIVRRGEHRPESW